MSRSFIAGDYLELASNAALNSGTVAFWLKTTQTTANTALLTRWSSTSRLGFGIALNVTANKLRVQAYLSTATSPPLDMAGTITVNDGNWHHVAMVLDLTTAANGNKLYVDGALDVQATAGSAWACSGNKVRVGKTEDSFWGQPVDDKAEIAWWSAQLTADEVAALAKRVSPLNIRPASLELYIPCWD